MGLKDSAWPAAQLPGVCEGHRPECLLSPALPGPDTRLMFVSRGSPGAA